MRIRTLLVAAIATERIADALERLAPDALAHPHQP